MEGREVLIVSGVYCYTSSDADRAYFPNDGLILLIEMSTSQTGFVPASRRVFSELTLVEIIIGIVIGLILVAFWTRFFKNLVYRTFRVDKCSTYQLFVVSFALTIIFIVLLNVIQALARDVVLGTPAQADVGTQGVSITSRNVNLAELRAESCCDGEESCCAGRRIIVL